MTPRLARAAVLVTFYVHGLLFASWTAHIPIVKRDLGIGDGELGFALLGVPAGSVSAVILTGWLLPRFGSRAIVLLGIVGYTVAGPLVGLTGAVPTLFVALLAWGAFQGMLDVAMNTQAIAVEHAYGRPLMNGFHAWWSFGAFTGAGAGTVGVALGLGLGLQLVFLGVPALVAVGLLALRMLPDAARSDPERDADPEPDAAAAPRARRVSPAMLLLGAIALASMLCEGAAADWSSVYLRDSLDGGKVAAGLGYTGFAFAMMIVRVAGDRLLIRFGLPKVLPALAGAAAAGFAIALAVGVVPVAVAGFFLLGLGLGAVVPSAFSAAGRLPGLHPGTSVAAVSGLGWVGFVLGPPMIGQLSAATSLPVALAVVPVLTAFVAVACARVRALRHEPAPVGVSA